MLLPVAEIRKKMFLETSQLELMYIYIDIPTFRCSASRTKKNVIYPSKNCNRLEQRCQRMSLDRDVRSSTLAKTHQVYVEYMPLKSAVSESPCRDAFDLPFYHAVHGTGYAPLQIYAFTCFIISCLHSV